MFDIGPMELLVVIGAAIMLFGGDLPDVARKAGRFVRRLRTLASEAARNLEAPDIGKLTGAAEFREELDVRKELDLEAEADIDWHDVARLPDEPPRAASAAPHPAPDAAPGPTAGAESPVGPAGSNPLVAPGSTAAPGAPAPQARPPREGETAPR